MGLSSNILWHQTTKDVLKKILKERSFKYSYSLEYIETKTCKLECAFPMLSLCNIPFADIDDYLTKYGGNSIGLSRDWGLKHGITPVIYCEPTSNLLESCIEIIKLRLDDDDNIKSFLVNLLSHIKNHEGVLPKYNYKKYRFYDEHEARIIPSFDELQQSNYEPILLKKEYQVYKLRNNKKSLLSKNLSIPFSYDDIRYFILKDENSINEIKEILSKTIDLNKLNISFFTIQQVKEDFIGINHNEILAINKIYINDKHHDNFPPINEKINLNK